MPSDVSFNPGDAAKLEAATRILCAIIQAPHHRHTSTVNTVDSALVHYECLMFKLKKIENARMERGVEGTNAK